MLDSSYLIFEMHREFVEALRNNPALRKNFFIGTSVTIILSIVMLISIVYLFWNSSLWNQYSKELAPLVTAFLIILFATFLLILQSYLPIRNKSTGELELREILDERGEIRKKVFEQPPAQNQSDILNTIELNLNHLSEYYVINKNQAKNSFKASLAAISIGFITIIVGIWFFYLNDTPNLYLTALSSISGILTETFGASYLLMYKESQKQLSYFFEKLYQTQNTMLALKINSDIDNKEKKIENLETIVISLIPPKKKNY